MSSATTPPTRAFTTMVIIAYAISSLSGVFVNKACLSHFDFSHPLTLFLCQLTVSITALSFLRIFKLVFIPPIVFSDVTVLCIPSVLFIANVTIGLVALRLVNIPMFSAFRRLTVLSVMLLEALVLSRYSSRRVMSAVFIMALGSFVAGLGDVHYDPLGYGLVFVNNFVTAANLVYIKKVSLNLSLNALSMFYYISFISLPIVFLLAVLSNDLSAAFRDVSLHPHLQSPAFLLALSLSAASAFLINFFTNLCTQITSPLTTAIAGQMKNVLQTILGIFAFGYIVTPLNLLGLSIALLGSIMFARLKYVDSFSSSRDESDSLQSQRLESRIDRTGDAVSTVSAVNAKTSNSQGGVYTHHHQAHHHQAHHHQAHHHTGDDHIPLFRQQSVPPSKATSMPIIQYTCTIS